MKLLYLVAVSFFLFGCITINPDGSIVIGNFSGNITIPDNFTINIPEPTTAAVMLPEKVKACLFGENSSVLESIVSQSITFKEKTVSVEAKWLTNNAKPVDFQDCALIILNDGGEGRYLDFVPRTGVKDRVNAGAGLIVSKEAATLVHDDPAIHGWDYILEGTVPVSLPEEPVNLTVSGTFVLMNSDEALTGLDSFNVTGLNLTDVIIGNGGAVALIRTGEFQTSVSYYAVVRGRSGKGITYYVSFSPQDNPSVFSAIASFLLRKSIESLYG